MFYEKSSQKLSAHQLATLLLRRNLELARLALLSGALAILIGMPLRLKLPREALLVVWLVPLALGLISWNVLSRLLRSPPKGMVERFARAVEEERKNGRPVRVISRQFVLVAGALSLVLSLAIVLLMPLR